MKYVLLSLMLVLPVRSFAWDLSEPAVTEEDYKSMLPPPLIYSERVRPDECKECSAKTFKEVASALRNEYDNYSTLRLIQEEAVSKKDEKKIAETEQEMRQSAIKYDKLMAALVSFKERFAKNKISEMEKKLKESNASVAQCRADLNAKSAMTVDDSNRSFFGKISEIFSWKRDTPAPVEDRSTGLSK